MLQVRQPVSKYYSQDLNSHHVMPFPYKSWMMAKEGEGAELGDEATDTGRTFWKKLLPWST